MPKKINKSDGYNALVEKIRREISETETLIKRRTAESYWKIGKFIHENILLNQGRAHYGARLFERLEKDVERDKATLQRTVRFYRAYPIPADRRELTWNHYRGLITIQDQKERKEVEEKALRNNWDSVDLENYLSQRRKEKILENSANKPAVKLSDERGVLFTYQVLELEYITKSEEKLVIDLGFKFLIHSGIKGLRLKSGDIIDSLKKNDAYSYAKSSSGKKSLYTYKAFIERIVDADTFWLNIDVGFSCFSRQKVRLRGIDAPELSTKKGIEAREFAEKRLKGADFIIVKTYKNDKYDRYLTDVFYLPGEKSEEKVLKEGIFLNQELLNNALAVEMKE